MARRRPPPPVSPRSRASRSSALERVQTPKGEYLAYRKRQRGKATADVLPDVLGGVLRALTFPKLMHWDATLDDGRGELLFGRPIRWILFVYGGRVVPFTITRTSAAQTSQVQDVSSGAVTYGHRFLTTSGRAGRAIKVRTFDEYRARLLENFVILERSERHDKIARELDLKAQRLQGRVSRVVPRRLRPAARGARSRRVPVGGGRDVRARVSRASRGSADDDADSPSALLSGRGRGRRVEERVSRRHQHRTGQRAHDRAECGAGRHGPAARCAVLLGSGPESHARFANRPARHAAVPQEARHATKRRRSGSNGWPAGLRRRRSARRRRRRRTPPARRASPRRTSTTDMVREFTELQGTMGGIYARHEGEPEEVWKAMYFHYLPIGVEADAPPTPRAARAKPPSRGPPCRSPTSWIRSSACSPRARSRRVRAIRTALRRAAQGVMKILTDFSNPSGGMPRRPAGDDRAGLQELRRRAPGSARIVAGTAQRVPHRPRDASARETRVPRRRNTSGRAALVETAAECAPARSGARARRENRPSSRRSPSCSSGSRTSRRTSTVLSTTELRARLTEPAEVALLNEMEARWPAIEAALAQERYGDAMRELGALSKPVDRFFTDVLVMAEDPELRKARLALLTEAPPDDSRYRRHRRDRAGGTVRLKSGHVRLKPDHVPDNRSTETEDVEEAAAAKESVEGQACQQARKYVYFFGSGQGRRQSHHEGPARRQGVGPRRDDECGPAGPAGIHDLDRGLQHLLPGEGRRFPPRSIARSTNRSGSSKRPPARRSDRPRIRCWSRCARARSSRCRA